MEDQTYDDGRAKNLQALLRALAQRISDLDARDALLLNAGELLKLTGDVRSELFHYEVRVTYDTPEIAEHRKLVEDAKRTDDTNWEPTGGWLPDDDEDDEWQSNQ